MLAVAPARAADVPISEEARTHFAAGVALLQDPKAPRYEEAYREFKAAYAASPSYKILGNLGLCAMKIERDAEAIDALETYLKAAGPELSQPEREQAQRDLLTLKTGVVHVTVSSDPPGATIVDVRTPIEGGDIRNVYGAGDRAHGARPSPRAPRDHGAPCRLPRSTVGVRGLRDHAPSPRVHDGQAGAAGGACSSRASRLRPGRSPRAAYVSGAVTVGLAATGAVIGLAAIQKHNDYNSVNDGLHVSEATSDKNSGQTLNAIADGFFGGAVLGADPDELLRARASDGGANRRQCYRSRAAADARADWGPAGLGGSLAAVWVY